jgi:hypothetical protein
MKSGSVQKFSPGLIGLRVRYLMAIDLVLILDSRSFRLCHSL